MVAVLDPVTLRPGGLLTSGNVGSDKVQEFPTYTCNHCNRVVVMHPDRTRERATCRKCMAPVCDLCSGVGDCNVFDADMELAFRDVGGQPWLLRHGGEPIDRIYFPDGSGKLVLRKDHNFTLTERTRSRRNDNA